MLREAIVRRTIDGTWRFTRSGVAAKYLEDGLAKLPALFGIADIDDERIVDYITYQLYRSRSALEDGRWKYTWLFSQAAMEKFKKQFLDSNGKSGMRYFIDQWLDEAELTRSGLTAIIAKPKPNPLRRMVYLESEEPIKRRFHNTPEGLALCQYATTGWSPLSAACKECGNWVECGKITAQKYPEIMRFRKEIYGKQKN